MRERLEAYANYFFGVAIALWVAAGVLFLLGNQPQIRLIALLAVGAVFFALFVIARPAQVRQAVMSRSARYGSNALVMSVAFVGIIFLANFLGSRYHYRQDTTANKTFTLSPLTIQALKDLKEPVRAVAFYTANSLSGRQQAEDELKLYANETDKFTYKFIDPEAEPQIARDYKIQFDGSIVLERGTRRQNVNGSDEQSLTNALLQVSQDTQPAIYFTTGHGEHSPEDTGENGYSLMKGALEAENYKVSLLNLTTITDTLPSDAAALIIAGPRQPFQPSEVEKISNYLDKNNGRVMILLDPQVDAGLDGLLKNWGITVHNDLVFDPKFGFPGQPQVPIISTYPSHTITDDLRGFMSFFPGSRSLEAVSPAPENKSVTALITTSDASWGETNFDQVKNQNAQFDSNSDTKGPLNLAYAIQTMGTDKPTRLVAVGNATFIANGPLSARITVGGQQAQLQSGNALFFGNSLHWLAGQENLIAIPPKSPDQHPIMLTGEQSSFVFWSTFLLVPGIILLTGGLTWWRRR